MGDRRPFGLHEALALLSSSRGDSDEDDTLGAVGEARPRGSMLFPNGDQTIGTAWCASGPRHRPRESARGGATGDLLRSGPLVPGKDGLFREQWGRKER